MAKQQGKAYEFNLHVERCKKMGEGGFWMETQAKGCCMLVGFLLLSLLFVDSLS